MKNGDISNKTAPIIAINFETIFNRKPTTMQRLRGIFGDSFKYKFNPEYRDLTLKLFDKFNIHIISRWSNRGLSQFKNSENNHEGKWNDYLQRTCASAKAFRNDKKPILGRQNRLFH